MKLKILYWDYERPDEAMISSQENFAAMVDEFEKRGCVVEKITATAPSLVRHLPTDRVPYHRANDDKRQPIKQRLMDARADRVDTVQ
jgi:hypothetical protein